MIFKKNVRERIRSLNGCFFPTLLMLALPAISYAQSGGGTPTVGPTTLTNPLRFDTITELFSAILEIITVFAVPVIVFFIVYAGFKYVTAGGNAEKVTSATHALTWALVGGVIVLGAQVLLAVIQSTVAALQP